jgi:hypothetical protein
VISTAECVINSTTADVTFALPSGPAAKSLYMVIRIEEVASNRKCVIDPDGLNVSIGGSSGNVSTSATFYFTGSVWKLVSKF